MQGIREMDQESPDENYSELSFREGMISSSGVTQVGRRESK